jgi:thiamine-phosphate pyrophosphorylase
MTSFDPRSLGVYVVTSATLMNGRSHVDVAEAALQGGATAIQLRAPELDDDALLPLATILGQRCAEVGALFVVNDRLEVAARVDGAGAHVGQGDDPADARAALGPARALGVSVASASQARAAAAMGADYLGVTVWRTGTKPEAEPGGLELVRAVVEAAGLPVVGIGGIDARNAGQVLDAGAVGVAVVSVVAAAPDPVAATAELRAAVQKHRGEHGGAS